MHFPYAIEPSPGRIRVDYGLPADTRHWVVWAYCGFYKNSRAESQPLVLVAFREWTGAHTLSDEITHRRVALTSLGFLRIGTVWSDQVRVAKVVFSVKQIDLDYDRENWEFRSFQESDLRIPYPRELYPLKYVRDQNEYLRVNLHSSGALVIPCIEVLASTYGWSKELVRVLATYPWPEMEGSNDDRLYGKPPENTESNEWALTLRKTMHANDTVFLAHAKYDAFTLNAAKGIYSQLDNKFDLEGKKPAFITVGPWHEGPAQLLVEGIPFDHGKSFLGLRIIGGSEPIKTDIRAYRDNPGKAENPADKDAGTAWAGRSGGSGPYLEKPLSLTSDEEPDHGSASIQVPDREFEYLGPRRRVHRVTQEHAEENPGRAKPPEKIETASGGEHYGQGKGVARALMHAEAPLESEGYLRDLWRAVMELHRLHPNIITSVEFFTLEMGYRKSIEPCLVAFKLPETLDGQSLTQREKIARNWVYVDRKNKLIRGMLIIRLRTPGKNVHLLEIQRKPSYRSVISSDGYRGLVIDVEDETQFAPWLVKLMSNLRYKSGVFAELLVDAPGKVDVFNHRSSAIEQFRHESALRHALKKIGVMLK